MFFIRGGVAAGTTCIVRVQVRGVRFDYFGQESSLPSLGSPRNCSLKSIPLCRLSSSCEALDVFYPHVVE